MGTDALPIIQENVRAALVDTGALFPTTLIDSAIFEAVSDISRLAPRELVHVEVLHSRTVTSGVTPTLTAEGTWYNILASGNVFPIDQQSDMTIKSSDGNTTYTEYTDYIIDYAQGKIQRIAGGSMTATTFLATYEKSLKGIDLSSLTSFISIDRVEIAKQGGSDYQSFSGYWQWGDILWLQSREGRDQGDLAEDDHVRIWYKAEHTKPGASAGSYPAYMDDIVVKGAVAYALFGKHRERNLQAVTDLATARTQLAIADDDQAAIDTLETAVTAALDSAKTSLAAADALADTPLGDANIALDAVIASLGTEAEALFDSATFTGLNTSIEAALDAASAATGLVNQLSDTPQSDANVALDASITNIGTEAEALLDAAAFTGINTSIESALDGAAAILDETTSSVETSLDKIVEHLETDATNPDSAEAQLAAGDSLINANTVGADVAALYARYAEMQVRISDSFVNEANARILQARGQVEEASQRVQQKQIYLAEVSERVSIASTYIAEARERLNIAGSITQAADSMVGEAAQRIQQRNSWLGEIDRRISIAGTYVAEARERIGIAESLHAAASGYVSEALGRMQQIDRHLALGNLYVNQARAYQEAADRENASADRFLFDAQERHTDYWEHLQSRVEMSWPNQRQAPVRQNA